MKPRQVAFLILSGCLIALAFGACTSDETRQLGPDVQATQQALLQVDQDTPGNSSEGAFFPLELGNHWEYHREFTLFEPYGPYVYTGSIERTVIGTENLFGRDYTVVKEVELPDEGALDETIWTLWYRYRQDRAGLYSADVNLSEPPGEIRGVRRSPVRSENGIDRQVELLLQRLCESRPPEQRDAYAVACVHLLARMRAIQAALSGSLDASLTLGGPPGGHRPEELIILSYPLHPGQKWTLRSEEFLVTAEVEAHEVLDVGAGRFNCFRVRMYSDILGPDDVVLAWYGREGLIAEFYRVEITVIDPYGNPVGTLVSEDEHTLESLSLSRGRFARQE